jgi:hypothetical protein
MNDEKGEEEGERRKNMHVTRARVASVSDGGLPGDTFALFINVPRRAREKRIRIRFRTL